MCCLNCTALQSNIGDQTVGKGLEVPIVSFSFVSETGRVAGMSGNSRSQIFPIRIALVSRSQTSKNILMISRPKQRKTIMTFPTQLKNWIYFWIFRLNCRNLTSESQSCLNDLIVLSLKKDIFIMYG